MELYKMVIAVLSEFLGYVFCIICHKDNGNFFWGLQAIRLSIILKLLNEFVQIETDEGHKLSQIAFNRKALKMHSL